VALGPGGVGAIHEWQLDEDDLAAVHASAAVVRAAAAAV
jgi:hypothetical protein